MYFWILSYMFLVGVTSSLKLNTGIGLNTGTGLNTGARLNTRLSTHLNTGLNTKFCVDCKYFVPNSVSSEYGKCSLFPIQNSNFLINGFNENTSYNYCHTTRSSDDLCGKNATKFKRIKKIKEVKKIN